MSTDRSAAAPRKKRVRTDQRTRKDTKKHRELLSLDDLDGRTQAAQHVHAALAAISEDPEAWVAEARKENAVVSNTVLRSLQLRWSKKETISTDERTLVQAMATAENTFNRTCQSILDRRDHEAVDARDASSKIIEMCREASEAETSKCGDSD